MWAVCVCPPISHGLKLLPVYWWAGLAPHTAAWQAWTQLFADMMVGRAAFPVSSTRLVWRGEASCQMWLNRSHFEGVPSKVNGLSGVNQWRNAGVGQVVLRR